MANHPNRGRRLGALTEFAVEAEHGALHVKLIVNPLNSAAAVCAKYDGGLPRYSAPPYAEVATPALARKWLAQPFRKWPSRMAYMAHGYTVQNNTGQTFTPDHSPL